MRGLLSQVSQSGARRQGDSRGHGDRGPPAPCQYCPRSPLLLLPLFFHSVHKHQLSSAIDTVLNTSTPGPLSLPILPRSSPPFSCLSVLVSLTSSFVLLFQQELGAKAQPFGGQSPEAGGRVSEAQRQCCPCRTCREVPGVQTQQQCGLADQTNANTRLSPPGLIFHTTHPAPSHRKRQREVQYLLQRKPQ